MLNQRKRDERRSLEAAQLSLLNKTIETQSARIKELESTVITDNTETLANALERIKALESLLARYGDILMDFPRAENDSLDRICNEIDAILPAAEGKKDE